MRSRVLLGPSSLVGPARWDSLRFRRPCKETPSAAHGRSLALGVGIPTSASRLELKLVGPREWSRASSPSPSEGRRDGRSALPSFSPRDVGPTTAADLDRPMPRTVAIDRLPDSAGCSPCSIEGDIGLRRGMLRALRRRAPKDLDEEGVAASCCVPLLPSRSLQKSR